MSDAASHKLKVSREGIILIKSFEGFRPRALRREDGGWVIGYGHTLSAREGATVAEADAELLLRYDLLAIERAVNAAAPTDLNQHQFDALASFALSVGLERFAASDVRQRLASGATGEAANAMMGWPERAVPETALRRRTAERALFVADPASAITLADLLVAPLGSTASTATEEPVTTPDPAPPVDARGAAVAALLGEPNLRLVQTEQRVIVPTLVEATAGAGLPSPSNDNPVEPTVPTDEAVAVHPTPEVSVQTTASPDVDAAALSPSRYSPYAAVMVGPLTNLQPLANSAPTQAEASPAEPEPAVAVQPAETAATSPAVTSVPTGALAPETTDDNKASAVTEASPVGEEAVLTEGGSVMRHEAGIEAPSRFDWREAGPSLFMGGVGLVSFGGAMAAFRRAAEQSGGGELSLIGWSLALIGLGCVGVSSVNLYRRLDRSRED